MQAEPRPVTYLHPGIADIYAEKVEHLVAALNDPEIREEACEILRGLITRIELQPRSSGKGLDAMLFGDLAEILCL